MHRSRSFCLSVGVLVAIGSMAASPESKIQADVRIPDDELRLVLQRFSVEDNDPRICHVATTIINKSEKTLYVNPRGVRSALTYGVRLWRFGTEELYQLEPNDPPILPTPLPPEKELKPGEAYEVSLRVNLERGGFNRSNPTEDKSTKHTVACLPKGQYAVDVELHLCLRVAEGTRDQYNTIGSCNKKWLSIGDVERPSTEEEGVSP